MASSEIEADFAAYIEAEFPHVPPSVPVAAALKRAFFAGHWNVLRVRDGGRRERLTKEYRDYEANGRR